MAQRRKKKVEEAVLDIKELPKDNEQPLFVKVISNYRKFKFDYSIGSYVSDSMAIQVAENKAKGIVNYVVYQGHQTIGSLTSEQFGEFYEKWKQI